MTPSGSKPETCRFVAYCLNHYATACPPTTKCSRIFLVLFSYTTVGSHFAMVRFTTIHFYDPCRVGLSTPDLWCIIVTTQASFLYLMCFQLFAGVNVFLLFLFQCSCFKLIVIFPHMTSIKKDRKEEKIKRVDVTFLLDVF